MKKLLCNKLGLVMLGVVVILLYFAIARQPYLFIAANDGVYHFMPVRTGAQIRLSFTHSVQRTPVVENFIVSDSYSLILDSTEYESLGVGLPFLAEDGVFHAGENKFVVSGMNRQHKRLDVRTGPEARLSLTYGEQNIPLYEVFPPGTLVHLWVGPFYSQWL